LPAASKYVPLLLLLSLLVATPAAATTVATGLAFYSLTPCRIVDTRAIGGSGLSGHFGPPSLMAVSARSYPIPESNCSVPVTAQAYSFNITAVPHGTLDYLTAWPTGQTMPVVSTLNSLSGAILANAAIVAAGTDGAISLYASNETDVIIDINGYFAPPTAANALAFYPATPCRVVDTRAVGGSGLTGTFGPPQMTALSTRSFLISSSSCGIPSSAEAYSFNMTVVPPGPLNYLSTWPVGQSMPLISTLNDTSGAVVANAAIVPAGTNGAVDVFAYDSTDLIIDSNGYFAPPGSPGALNFYPLTPCRVVDTRAAGGSGLTGDFGPPQMTAGSNRSFPVPASSCGVPATAQAYSLNMTVVPPGPLNYITTWPTGQAMPIVSTLNDVSGTIVANAAIVPAGASGAISVLASNNTELIIDVNGYFAPAPTTPVTVSLTPTAVSLLPSQSQTFAATVAGTSNTGVNWSLSPDLGGLASGTTTAAYVAPSTAPTTQSVTITAASMADASTTAIAVITLLQAVTVSMSPTSVSLGPTGTQQFTTTVLGSTNTAVTWSINPSAGTISSAGLYTAPASITAPETITVTAQSVANPAQSASATVALTPVTYYVDSVNGSDSNPGTQASPWKTIAKVNATRLLPGQTVAFQAGEIWREQLTVSSSGSAGAPITFTSYGSGALPIISGANVFSSWTASASGYYSSYAIAPNQVFGNATRLTQVSSQSALVTGSWWLDTANLRIYVYDDPSGQTMEASLRNYAIYSPCANHTYITITNLQMQESNIAGIYQCGSNVWNVTNSVIQFNFGQGLRYDGGAAGASVTYTTAAYNGQDGLAFYQTPSLLVDHCVTHDNAQIPANISGNYYSAGIKMEPGGSPSSNIVVRNSTSYSNGIGQCSTCGGGIWADTTDSGWTVYNNITYLNHFIGIDIDATSNALVYDNVSYQDNYAGIFAFADGQSSITGNQIYNNTVWGTTGFGIEVEGPNAGPTTNGCTNNLVKNNIVINSTGPNLYAANGCENTGTNGSGNIYTNNALGVAASNFIEWGVGKYHSTYAAWETATGNCGTAGCSHSIQGNPLLVSPPTNFNLQPGSPALGTGIYISGIDASNPPNVGAIP
jgi:Right handed beta helix region